MPVLVTAADAPLGRELVERLVGAGGQIRAFCTGAGPSAPLRAAGAIVATGDLLDEGHLERAMEQVHTVVHLAGVLPADSADTVLGEAATVLTAALGAGVRRIIALSVAGAAGDAADPYRRAHGEIEQLLAEAPVPSVALRASLVDSPALRDALAATPDAGTHRDVPVAPVRPRDLVEIVAFLDEVRSAAHEGHVVLGVAGPERLTLGTYLERVGVDAPGRVGQLVGRVWRSSGEHDLLAGALAGPWIPDPELPDAFEVAQLTPRPVAA